MRGVSLLSSQRAPFFERPLRAELGLQREDMTVAPPPTETDESEARCVHRAQRYWDGERSRLNEHVARQRMTMREALAVHAFYEL